MSRYYNGLLRYQYHGRYGAFEVRAADHADALREAARSLSGDTPVIEKLQVWNGAAFVPAQDKASASGVFVGEGA